MSEQECEEHTGEGEPQDIGVLEDVTFASNILRRLLDTSGDQERIRNTIYRQNTTSTFRKICETFEVPVDPNDTKFVLFNALTTWVNRTCFIHTLTDRCIYTLVFRSIKIPLNFAAKLWHRGSIYMVGDRRTLLC
jgi:hypothetical protein